MRAVIVSSDLAVANSCRKLLSEFPNVKQINVVNPGGEVPPSELYIWDLTPGLSIPDISESKGNRLDLVVVARKDSGNLLEALPKHPVAVLLKPLQQDVLKAYLAKALSQFGDPTEKLKSDRDSLLDFVLHANLKIQEFDQDRNNFIARAMHDFRAPLTALHGYCGLLLDRQVGQLSPDQLDLLRRMQRSIKRISNLTRSMLELSLRRTTERQPNFAVGNIEACIHQALHEICPMAESKGIVLTAEIAPPPQPLKFDADNIEQVLTNLLENAVKFTRRNGAIQVRAMPVVWNENDHEASLIQQNGAGSPNAYHIAVQDTGPGIPAHLRAHVFEEFTSYSNGSDRSGGGLGLAICKMLTEAHHGRIWAESDSDGCTLSVLLPLAVSESFDIRKAAHSEVAMQRTFVPSTKTL